MWSILLADVDKIQDAIGMFRWAITVMGIGVVLIGFAMYLYRPKDETKRSSPTARKTALFSFGLIGISTIVYAWTWFGK